MSNPETDSSPDPLLEESDPPHEHPRGAPAADPLLGPEPWPTGTEGALARARASGRPIVHWKGAAGDSGIHDAEVENPLFGEALALQSERLKLEDGEPVVRILAPNGIALAEVRPGPRRIAAVLRSLIEGCVLLDQRVPNWVRLELARLEACDACSIRFDVPAEGGADLRLGAMTGILGVRAEHRVDREHLEVHFDPRRISPRSLILAADGGRGVLRLYTDDAEQRELGEELLEEEVRPLPLGEAPLPPSETHLSRSDLALVPLTRIQATRIESTLAREERVEALLSPNQWTWRNRLRHARATRPEVLEGLVRVREDAGLADYILELGRRLG